MGTNQLNWILSAVYCSSLGYMGGLYAFFFVCLLVCLGYGCFYCFWASYNSLGLEIAGRGL